LSLLVATPFSIAVVSRKIGPNLGEDGLGGLGGVDQAVSLGEALGFGQESGADLTVEFKGFAVEPVLVLLARQPDGRVEVEEVGSVGHSSTGGEAVEGSEPFELEAAPVPLIDDGGIHEAIADDDRAAGEGGFDDGGDVLASIREEKEEFGAAIDGVGLQEEPPNLGSECTRAGLAGLDHGSALGFEAEPKARDLGGFSAAFGSLKGDEHAYSSTREK
jgi:hypothetical protein